MYVCVRAPSDCVSLSGSAIFREVNGRVGSKAVVPAVSTGGERGSSKDVEAAHSDIRGLSEACLVAVCI
eukprot:6200379-Pleurochrysis_carterae.AAC.1